MSKGLSVPKVTDPTFCTLLTVQNINLMNLSGIWHSFKHKIANIPWWFSKRGPQTSGLSHTWEFVRNASSLGPQPTPTESETQLTVFQQAHPMILMHVHVSEQLL